MSRTPFSLAALAAVMVGGVGTSSVAAQTLSDAVGRLQVGAGIGWLGGSAFGERPADLRTASGAPYRLFQSETDLGSSGSFEARVGILLSRRYGVEGRVAISKPALQAVVTSDAEATGSFTIAETVDHYAFDGGVVVRLPELEGMGFTPFASAGAGYVRQLHEGQALVESGHLFYVGGGFTRPLFSRSQGLIRAMSVRADLRLNLFYLELDEGSRQQGSVSGSLVLTF
jgi:hypothetical protein